jgi:hypothetical protein
MSHKHNPPRLSPLARSRKPRTELKHGRAPAKASAANAEFNASAQRSNEPGKVTPGQMVAAGLIRGA